MSKNEYFKGVKFRLNYLTKAPRCTVLYRSMHPSPVNHTFSHSYLGSSQNVFSHLCVNVMKVGWYGTGTDLTKEVT